MKACSISRQPSFRRIGKLGLSSGMRDKKRGKERKREKERKGEGKREKRGKEREREKKREKDRERERKREKERERRPKGKISKREGGFKLLQGERSI